MTSPSVPPTTTVRIAEEAEYIRLTNLAKIRIAETILRDIHPFGPIRETLWREVRGRLEVWRLDLEEQGTRFTETGENETYEVIP